MIQGSQDVGFAFKVAHDRFLNGRIARHVDHFFDCHPLDNIWKVQIAGAIDGSHATDTNNALDQVTIGQGGSGLKVFGSLF